MNISLDSMLHCFLSRCICLSLMYIIVLKNIISGISFNIGTGLKDFPFQLKPVPRLHWEDPTADHLMTHEVLKSDVHYISPM